MRWLVLPLLWSTGEIVLSLCQQRDWQERRADIPGAFGLGWILLCCCWLIFNQWLTLTVGWYLLVPILLALALSQCKDRPATEKHLVIAWNRFDLALFGLLLLLLTTVVFLTLALPILDWDTRIIWALKAKFLAASPTMKAEVFVDPYRLHIHPRYPLLAPWLGALLAGEGTYFSERVYQGLLLLVGALALWQFAAQVCVVAGRRMALLYTLLFLVSGVWLQALFASSVEIVLVFFLLLALATINRWLESTRRKDLLIAGLFVAALSLTKNEGLLLAMALILGVVAVSWQKENLLSGLQRGGMLALVWLPLYGLWLVQMRLIPAVSDENYWQRLNFETLAAGFSRSDTLVAAVGQRMVAWPLWHLTWLLPAVILLCLWQRRGRLRESGRVAAIVATLYPAGILLVYLLSPWRDLAMHVNVTFDRVMLPVLPLLLLLLATVTAVKGDPDA